MARIKTKVLENEDKTNAELARRKDKSDQDKIVKLQTKNAAASAQIAATQAQLQADLAKKEIDITISKIDTKKQIELSGLQERARLENLSAVQIADERFRIEMEAAKKLSAQKSDPLKSTSKRYRAAWPVSKNSWALQRISTTRQAFSQPSINLKRTSRASVQTKQLSAPNSSIKVLCSKRTGPLKLARSKSSWLRSRPTHRSSSWQLAAISSHQTSRRSSRTSKTRSRIWSPWATTPPRSKS